MTPAPADLVPLVRDALIAAGFHLVGKDDERTPGLRVTPIADGVLIKWTASDGFTALARDQAGASGDTMKAVVQAAVSGLLVQLGHTVTETDDGAGLLVLTDG